ncbi:DUF6146 family protein [Snuella sedimenti]|uniref:Lipoprotein n=1 Tax=Snuella sedimenti TaxID=2798802 RepID=A0A8J7LSW7_9FLAO|nr:DUF6146 family protein [Snuella sedimenti]MBJ6367626.1 hypothetical protein [Snuella sedimenti]
MKTLVYLVLAIGILIGCNTSKTMAAKEDQVAKQEAVSDTVRIANDKLEYEIIIIEPGFNFWLASRAKPEGYYSQQFMENRNMFYVNEWNRRVLNPMRYNPNLYEMQIDYQNHIDYGYDVNYKLYNYFIYFQLTYKQRLAGFIPRI